jgi:hypothetical protein
VLAAGLEHGQIQLLESQQGSTGGWQVASVLKEEYVLLERLTDDYAQILTTDHLY